MRSVLLPFFVSVCLVAGTSCVRTSTVVRVKKDGSGTIVLRHYFSPQITAMGGGLGALGGNGAEPDFDGVLDIAKPDEESLREDAANFGEGVRYSRHEADTDEDGWEGYMVVYEFDDIGKVRLHPGSIPGQAKEFVESIGQEIPEIGDGGLRFFLEGDLLIVRTGFANGGLKGLVSDEQIDQAKDLGIPPSQALKLAAGLTAGMRLGLFVEAEDGIADTTAEHVEGGRIVLSDADVPKVISDPIFGAFLDEALENRDAIDGDAIRILFKKLEAIVFESADEFAVRLK